MAYLLDTSILARLANSTDVQHAIAIQSVTKLKGLGEFLHVSPQNLVEFRRVATRPVANNGLGLSCADAERLSNLYETVFPLLAETPDIFPAWKSLAQNYAVIGKQVHDARIVAICHARGISHLLTFNVGHFARFAATPPGLVVVDPKTI